MTAADRPLVDQTLQLAREGYAFLPNRRRAAGSDVITTRVLGRRVVAACGPAWTERFYDAELFDRSPAIPEPVRSTLFGNGAVHTLDGAAHEHRKQMFTTVLGPAGIEDLTDAAVKNWHEAAAGWCDRGRIVLLDEAAEVLLQTVWGWTGLASVTSARPGREAPDLVSLVDGFATIGPRHWRARVVRRRQEHRVADVVRRLRTGVVSAPAGSALAAVATHRDGDGALLPAEVAAVELLNIVRPTVAITWFVTFAAHALHRWPRQREPLRAGDRAHVEAFVHEIRRFYPFAPFLGAVARRHLGWEGHQVAAGGLVLLDLFGQNHHSALWEDPYRFDPRRFVGHEIGPYALVPQGGGDPTVGHRCPGEQITVALLTALLPELARLDYRVPDQDLRISLARIPSRPVSGMVLEPTRPGAAPEPGHG